MDCTVCHDLVTRVTVMESTDAATKEYRARLETRMDKLEARTETIDDKLDELIRASRDRDIREQTMSKGAKLAAAVAAVVFTAIGVVFVWIVDHAAQLKPFVTKGN